MYGQAYHGGPILEVLVNKMRLLYGCSEAWTAAVNYCSIQLDALADSRQLHIDVRSLKPDRAAALRDRVPEAASLSIIHSLLQVAKPRP